MLATGVLTISLSACGVGASDDAAAGSDDTLTFASPFAQTTLDPDHLPLRQMAMYTAPMYDSLTYLDGDEALQPMLATKWESGSDAKGPFLDLTLREGLSFDDGTPFTAKTVAVNVKRSQELEGSSNAGNLAGVTVEQIDKTHVRLRSERGVGQLPRLLAGTAGQMISDKAIADKVDLTREEAGIGAFNLESVQPNRVVYSANADYWDDKAAAVKTLEVEYLADDAKLNAVRSGNVDITILPEKMVQPAEDAGYGIERSYGAENYSFSMNTDMKPFDDPKVREAVNLAVDREGMCQAVLSGACEVNGQLFGSGTDAYAADLGLREFDQDVERAKSLIQEAGAEGATVDIVTVAGNQAFEQFATIFQEQLAEIGLKANVLPLAPPQVVSRFTVEKNVALAFGAIGNAFDPSESLERYILPTGLYNPGGFSNPSIEKEAAAALKETDQDTRDEMYQKISAMAETSGFFVPLMTPETAYVIAGHVEGWESPWAPSFPSFRGVSG